MIEARLPVVVVLRTMGAFLLAAVLVLAGSPAQATSSTLDAAVTRKLDTRNLATTSKAARCMDDHAARRLRAGAAVSPTRLARTCGLRWARTATVRGRGSAKKVADVARTAAGIRAALRAGEHLAVADRGRGASRVVVVMVAATSRTAAPPGPNGAPTAAFYDEHSYGSLDTDPVTVELHDDSFDGDGQVASRSWAVTAPDGNPVAVQVIGTDAVFVAAAAGGTYRVTLTVTDDTGTKGTTTEQVHVREPMSDAAKAALERSILESSNSQRSLNGIAPLRWHECLALNARNHSVTVAVAGALFHQTGLQVAAACPEPLARGGGENVLYRQFPTSGAAAVTQWMNSPGHRANILNASFTHMGVGVHYDREADVLYATQVFYSLGS